MEVGRKKALWLVTFKYDPTNRRMVSSWPVRFDDTYPLSLGFGVDEGGLMPIVEQFRKDVLNEGGMMPAISKVGRVPGTTVRMVCLSFPFCFRPLP